jgi:hypothetical protein
MENKCASNHEMFEFTAICVNSMRDEMNWNAFQSFRKHNSEKLSHIRVKFTSNNFTASSDIVIRVTEWQVSLRQSFSRDISATKD